MDRESVTVGGRYAYRARGIDPLVQVQVLKVGTQKPARVQIAWVGEQFEGRQEWVPPARLKVTWDRVGEFIAAEERWAAVREPSPGNNSVEANVAGEIVESCIDRGIADCGYNADSGVITMYDVPRLAQLLDIPEEELRSDPLSFTEDDALVASWHITEKVARRAAVKFADTLLAEVAADEQKARHEAISGYDTRGYRGTGTHHISAEICREVDAKLGMPRRAMLRSWCGEDAVERYDELVALRDEVVRLGTLVHKAADRLRVAGHLDEAKALEHELGLPVAELR